MSLPNSITDTFVKPDPALGFFQLGLLMILAFTFGALDWLFVPILGLPGYPVIIYTIVILLVCAMCANFVLPIVGFDVDTDWRSDPRLRSYRIILMVSGLIIVLPTIGLVSFGLRVTDLMEAAPLIGWALRLSAIVAWAGAVYVLLNIAIRGLGRP